MASRVLSAQSLQRPRKRPVLPLLSTTKHEPASLDRFARHLSVRRSLVIEVGSVGGWPIPLAGGQQLDPAYPRREKAARQMAVRQQQPLVSGMLHQPLAVFTSRCCKLVSDHLSILFAAPSAAKGSPGCRQSRSTTAAPRSTGTGGSSGASSSLPAAFLDPLLRSPALVVEAHYRRRSSGNLCVNWRPLGEGMKAPTVLHGVRNVG
jgi:hypothetical protein